MSATRKLTSDATVLLEKEGIQSCIFAYAPNYKQYFHSKNKENF